MRRRSRSGFAGIWYQGYRSSSWRVDETYVRIGGAWKYLFRAVDKMRNWPPVSITTDKLVSYPRAIRRLKRHGSLSDDVTHLTSHVEYLNNIIEAEHSVLKQLIRPARGFQTMNTACATIKGFEIMRMIRRGHCIYRELGLSVRSASSTNCSGCLHSGDGQKGKTRPSRANARKPECLSAVPGATACTALKEFAAGLRRDIGAIQAALEAGGELYFSGGVPGGGERKAC